MAGAARCDGRSAAGTPAGRSDALAYQAVKYRQRDGVTHRDVLRLAHPAGRVSAGNPSLEVSPEHAALFEWIVRGTAADGLPRIVEGFVAAQAAETPKRAAALVREYRLPREALQPEHLTSAEVWDGAARGHADDGARPQPGDDDPSRRASLRGRTAPPRWSRSSATASGSGRLGSTRSRVLAALRTYGAGHGARGRGVWNPVREVIDALDAAFYTAFENVEPTGKRLLLALDVSGSMVGGQVAGVPGLTPRDASAALALVTAATESRYEIVGFFAGDGGFRKRGRRPVRRPRRRSDAAVDLAAPAARRRGQDGLRACRSAAPTARCRCSTRRRWSERSTRS